MQTDNIIKPNPNWRFINIQVPPTGLIWGSLELQENQGGGWLWRAAAAAVTTTLPWPCYSAWAGPGLFWELKGFQSRFVFFAANQAVWLTAGYLLKPSTDLPITTLIPVIVNPALAGVWKHGLRSSLSGFVAYCDKALGFVLNFQPRCWDSWYEELEKANGLKALLRVRITD